MIKDGDALVLWGFCVFAVTTGGLVYLFFVTFRQHREPLRWSKLFLGNTLILLLLVSLILFCGEVYYRFLIDDIDAYVISKVTRSWSQRHFQQNEFGFRDSLEYSREIPAGQRRITLLGEAFTVGHGIADVDDRFANRVRRDLHPHEVHVIAEPAWDTGEHLWLTSGLPADGFQLNMVVLVYSLDDAMDIVDEWQSLQDRFNDPGRWRFWVNHSYLVNTWYYRAKAVHDPDFTKFGLLMRDNYAGPAWESQQQRLATLHDTIESFSGSLLVVTVPHLYALGEDYPYQVIHELLGQYWARRGVPHLDLLPVFADKRSADLVLGDGRVFPNEKSHQLAADAILVFLREYMTASGEG